MESAPHPCYAILSALSVLKIPIARLPVLGLGGLLQQAGSPGGRHKIAIYQLLHVL